MKIYGIASVYGVDGSITAGAAYLQVESAEDENTASIEEFTSGINQLLGFYKSNERLMCDLTLVPKAATLANAHAALAFPVGPCKVTLSGFPDDGTATGNSGRQTNGDYIYTQGARRTRVRGQNGFRMSIFRPLDLPSGVTIDTLVTEITS